MKCIHTIALLALAGCGSSTGNLNNPDDISVTVTETAVSFATGDTTRDFVLDDEQLFDGISSSSDGDDKFYTRQSDDAVAALLVTDSGMVTPYFARSVDIDVAPDGTGTATGRYIGALTTPDGADIEQNSGISEIAGDVVLEVDFDTQTLSGDITNRTLFLEGLPFEFFANTNIVLRDGQINDLGQFRGVAQAIEGDVLIDEPGMFNGLQGGDDGRTFVGQVVIPGETGVFLAD